MASIVLVEDYIPLSTMLADFLRARGRHRVTSAANAQDGLTRIWAAKPDVVLLDLSLGDDDGMNVLRKAKASGCQAKFLIMTGTSDVRKAVEAIKMGAEDYWTKPLKLETLHEQIELMLKKDPAQETVPAKPETEPEVASFFRSASQAKKETTRVIIMPRSL